MASMYKKSQIIAVGTSERAISRKNKKKIVVFEILIL